MCVAIAINTVLEDSFTPFLKALGVLEAHISKHR